MNLEIFLHTSVVVSPHVIEQCGCFPWDPDTDLHKICKQNSIVSSSTEEKECLLEGEWKSMINVFDQIVQLLDSKSNKTSLITDPDIKVKEQECHGPVILPNDDNSKSYSRSQIHVTSGVSSHKELPVDANDLSDSTTHDIVNNVTNYIDKILSPSEEKDDQKPHPLMPGQEENESNIDASLLNIDSNQLKCEIESETEGDFAETKNVSRQKSKKRLASFKKTCKNEVESDQETRKKTKRRKNEVKEYSCRICPFSASKKNVLIKHETQMHKGRTWACSRCDKAYKFKNHLKEHEKTHFRELNHCELCGKSFKGKKYFEQHQRDHEKKKVKEYSCQFCPFTARKKNDLVKHETQMHEERIWACPRCDKVYKCKRHLKEHEKTHFRELSCCDICGKFFKGKRYMEQHRRSHEENYVKPEFECDTCKKVFSTKYVLDYHIKSQHMGIKKQFLCPTCGKSFSQKNSFLQHSNVHKGLKPYQCEHCGKSFAYEKSLKEHRFMHDNILRFKCEECGKQFRQSTSLQSHRKIHKEAKDFLCGTCGKGFTQKQALVRHERIHNGRKPFCCGLCLRTFNDASIIRRHMILVHKKDSKEWRTDVQCDLQGSKEYWINGKNPEMPKQRTNTQSKSLAENSNEISTAESNSNKRGVDDKKQDGSNKKDKNTKDKSSSDNETSELINNEIGVSNEKIMPSSFYVPCSNAEVRGKRQLDSFVHKKYMKMERSNNLLHTPNSSQRNHNPSVSLDPTFESFTTLHDRKPDGLDLTFQASRPGRSEKQWTPVSLPSNNVHFLPHHHFTNYQNQ